MSGPELDAALATLVLELPLRVAVAPPRLYLDQRLAQAFLSLKGEAWRTPLARAYGRLCERGGTPGDCLALFEDGPGLDGEDKRDLALALSVNTALEALDAEVRATFSATQLSTMVSLTLAGYLALLVAPEPVSKGVAAALTLLMWGYLGWELLDLVRAYFQLWEEAAEAATFEELRTAGDRFGRVIGPNSMRILLLLGTAAVGETAALVSKAPTLPGFAKAAQALESQAGLDDVLVALQPPWRSPSTRSSCLDTTGLIPRSTISSFGVASKRRRMAVQIDSPVLSHCGKRFANWPLKSPPKVQSFMSC